MVEAPYPHGMVLRSYKVFDIIDKLWTSKWSLSVVESIDKLWTSRWSLSSTVHDKSLGLINLM